MDFYQYVAKAFLDRMINQEGYDLRIPFEHMYFVSIEEFELLTGGVSSGQFELSELLEDAVNSVPYLRRRNLNSASISLTSIPEA